MARVICIMGESGAGKTTSLRNLDPKTTFIIDADRKGLSWRGWKKQYNNANRNYVQTSNVAAIEKCMERIDSQDLQNIKVMVIDTLNAIMIDDEMARMKEKNFDKWQDLATCIWRIVSKFHLMRDDLTVVCIAHTQEMMRDFTSPILKQAARSLTKSYWKANLQRCFWLRRSTATMYLKRTPTILQQKALWAVLKKKYRMISNLSLKN